MLTYKKASSNFVTPLIPGGRSAMFRVFYKFKKNRQDLEVQWAVKGKPPILKNSSLLNTIHLFEKDIVLFVALILS